MVFVLMSMTPADTNNHAELNMHAVFLRIVNHQIENKTFAWRKKQVKIVKWW